MSQYDYKTLSGASHGEYREKGSKFLAYAFPLESAEDLQGLLDAARKDHPKARHHCYAYRIGFDGNNFRANDDGEPSGTAGRPILGQIDSAGLTNVLIIVVRYFGGTLLGTSGLIHAYKTSAADAISNGVIKEKTVHEVFIARFEYRIMGELMDFIKHSNVQILKQEFNNEPSLEIAIPKAEVDGFMISLKAHLAKVSLVEAATLSSVPGLELIFSHTI